MKLSHLDSIGSAYSDNGGQLAGSLVIHSLVEVAAEQDEGDCDAHHQAAHLGSGCDCWHHNGILGLWPNLRSSALIRVTATKLGQTQ